jgi:hypothetical protein
LGGTFTIIFDWITAFASKLAHTGFVVFLWEGWWLGWPHREQAHSYILIFGVSGKKPAGSWGRRRGGNLDAETVAQ